MRQRSLFAPQRRPERIPLSFSQERLWSLEKKRLKDPVDERPAAPLSLERSPEEANRHHGAIELIHRNGCLRPRFEIANDVPPPQNLASTVHVAERVSVEALEQSVCVLMARHEILRTRLQVAEQGPYQVIDPLQTTFRVELKDLSTAAPAPSAPRVQRILVEEASRPFDLLMQPPLRVMVLKLSATESVVVVVVHEIICDEPSLAMLTDELAQLYAAFSTHEPTSPANHPVQYADYAIWERAWLHGEPLQPHIEVWNEYLKQEEVEFLSTDMTRPKSCGFTCVAVELEISEDLSEKLLLFSRRESVTPYALLLAAFEVLLSLLSRHDKICVAAFTPGRDQHRTAEMLGPFAKALAVRADLSGYRNFKGWVNSVQTALDEAAAKQVLPLEDVMTLSDPADPWTLPRLRVGFRWTDVSAARNSWSLPHVWRVSTQFDLALSVRQIGACVVGGCLEFASELFDVTSAQRGADDLVSLLHEIVSDLK